METIPENELENGNVTVASVTIKTEKFEKNGVQYRHILAIDGCITEIEAKSIPGYVKYMSGQAIYQTKFGTKDEATDAIAMVGHKKNVPHIVVGRVLREDLFQNAVRHIGLALNRLVKVKQEQIAEAAKIADEEALREVWEGEDIITIRPNFEE